MAVSAVSQVEAAVRKVEALVADWKIGYGLPAEREGKPRPVVKRRIDDLVAAESAVRAGQGGVAHFAPPSLDQGDRQGFGGGRGYFRPDRSEEHTSELQSL